MEILLLGIYSFFVWLIFFKFKWLPWNIVSQVIVITLPIFGLTALILLLNIVAPSSHDIRVINYVVPINPPVRGLVTEVPIEPNRPIKKGDVLFKVDPTPFEIAVRNYEAQLAQLRVQLVTAEANARNLQEQVKSATGQRAAIESKLKLAQLRLQQFKELAEAGAGNKFDAEQAQADVQNLEGQLASTIAKSWFTASETWLQRQIAAQMLQAAQELVRLAEKRLQVGAGTEQDVALARAGLGNFQDAETQVRLAHGQALRALELLLGRYPGAELEARHDLAALPGPIPGGLPLEMLERRPDMVAAERRVAAAFHRVGEAKAARLPRLVLNANVAAIQSDILQLKNDFENPTGGAGAKLIAPIYQGGALKTQVEIRTLEQQQAVAEYARLALRALGDVENALASSQTLSEREAFLRRAESDQARALSLAQTSYRVGQADQRAVEQQRLNLNSSRLALLRVQSERLSQRVNLHLALGGSFEPAPPPADTEPRDEAAQDHASLRPDTAALVNPATIP